MLSNSSLKESRRQNLLKLNMFHLLLLGQDTRFIPGSGTEHRILLPVSGASVPSKA